MTSSVLMEAGPIPAETMKPPAPITYRFERADCWQLARMLFRPTLKRRLLSLVFMAICILLGLALGIGHWPTAREWAFLSRSPQLLGLVVMLLALSQFAHYVNVVTVWLRYRQLALIEEPVVVSFGPERLETEIGGARASIPWRNFVARTEMEDRVFLKLGRWEAVTIPRRAFPDDAAWQGALAFLREKVPHAG